MKTNFRKNNHTGSKNNNSKNDEKVQENLTREEFENYLLQSGAAGSFMVFRSKQKKDELGLDEL